MKFETSLEGQLYETISWFSAELNAILRSDKVNKEEIEEYARNVKNS